MSQYKLSQEICNLSTSKNWNSAKLEWDLDSIYQSSHETCLCGHYPISEICVLRNRLNNRLAEVGNICVKKFIGLPSDKMFRSVKSVNNDETKKFIEPLVLLAHSKGWINDWEKDFYSNIRSKKTLSENQTAKKLQINRKILNKIISSTR